MVEKITLNADKAYVIRSRHTIGLAVIRTEYYMHHTIWTSCPTDATIYRDLDAAEKQVYTLRYTHAPFVKDCILEAVPLYGEIITSPNGKTMIVKRGPEEA